MENERKPTLDERLAALAMNVELLQGSVSDLTAIVHAQVAENKAMRERDRRYFHALAQLLESWAGNGEGK